MAHTITFEFIPEDSAFFMNENKVTEGKVKHVQAKQDNYGVYVKYCVVYPDSNNDNYPATVHIPAENIFKSKKELLESL